jgi:NADPH:quinone reductase-like Zn-dependent oxidoreductase
MRAFVIEELGFDGLRVTQREPRPLGRGEVMLRMLAMALNHRDVEIVLGTYSAIFEHPLVPLSDGVGEVVGVGDDVTRVRIGDRAVVAFWERWNDGPFNPIDAGASLGGPRDGVLCEQFVTFEDRLVLVPDGISDVEAASLPCSATTAWHSLIAAGRIRPGDSVLIQGTGSVSLFAMQLALMVGAKPIVTSSSDDKLERVKESGVTCTINYKRTPEWSGQVLDYTAGRGVDHVIEVGGPGSFAQSLKAIRAGGQINVIGYLGGKDGTINPLDIFRRQATVRGIPVGSRAMLEGLIAGILATGVHPIIDRVFPWHDAASALRHLHSGTHFGKVVLRVD